MNEGSLTTNVTHTISDKEPTELTRKQQLELEAYRTISQCIDRDSRSDSMLERMLLPAIVIAPIYAIQQNGLLLPLFICGGGLLLLSVYFLKTWKCENRNKIRHDILREKEACLGFRAHLEVYERILKQSANKRRRDYHIKHAFGGALLILYAILL